MHCAKNHKWFWGNKFTSLRCVWGSPSRERHARSFGPRRTSCAAGSWGSAGVRHSDLLSLGGGSGVFSGGSVSVAFLFIMEFFPFRRLFASCFPGCRGALSLVRGREGSCWPKRPKAPLLAPRHPLPPPLSLNRKGWGLLWNHPRSWNAWGLGRGYWIIPNQS